MSNYDLSKPYNQYCEDVITGKILACNNIILACKRYKEWFNKTDRFFAGIPNVPNKDKDKMAIYLCFIQHILYSLKDNGKAAIVVPTGFITAQNGIEKTIRQYIVNKKWLKGVISMPANIFPNTGTNVSVLFIDKSNKDNEAFLMDASNMGTKVKIGKLQKTVLSDDELNYIVSTFVNKNILKDFSTLVSFDEMSKKNCSFSAGQYSEVILEYSSLSKEDFNCLIDGHKNTIKSLVDEINKTQKEIDESLRDIKYDI